MVSLKGLKLFDGVGEEKLNLLRDGMRLFFRDGDVIMREGEIADSFVVLLKGSARVSFGGTYLVTRSAGELIGEQALIDKTRRSATITADGTVEALCIPTALFETFLTDGNFTRNLLQCLSQKLSQATADRSFRYRVEERLFAEFSAHVAPQVRNELLATGQNYGAPRNIEAVILMADVRSFTTSCKSMHPSQIAAEITPYLDAIVGVIHEHDGFVDKFIGDAVLAFWGYTPDSKAAFKAFQCARAMVKQAAQLTFGGAPIKIGVGLNFGHVFVGNVGGEGKRQFTVLGTPVNFTQRYESMTKELNAEIVAGEAFFNALPDPLRTGWMKQVKYVKGDQDQVVYSFSMGQEMPGELVKEKGAIS